MHFELTHNIGAVCFGCLDADPKSYCDFFAAFAFRHELYDLALSRRQGFTASEGVCCEDWVAKVIDQCFSCTRCEE